MFYRLLGWQFERFLGDSRVPMIKVYLDLEPSSRQCENTLGRPLMGQVKEETEGV